MPDFAPKYPQNRQRIKTEFTSSILRETAQAIRDEQSKIASAWSLFDSGELEKSLVGHFTVTAQGSDAKLSMRYLTYARFLDMADPRRKLKKEGFHLYNRTIFGLVYGKMVPQLKFGLTEEVSQQISKKLQTIAAINLPFYKKVDLQIKEISTINPVLGAMMSKSYRLGY